MDESMPDVVGRMASAFGDIESLDTSDPTKDVEASASAAQGAVSVLVRGGRVASIHLDQAWLETQHADDVSVLLERATNEALAEFEKRALAEIQLPKPDTNNLMRTLGQLQADLNAAYGRDLDRLVESHRPPHRSGGEHA